ncbi:MAG: hypothetical protein ACYTFZ_08690 [Planctomycetota bacterium]|jgi:hypothetical protein
MIERIVYDRLTAELQWYKDDSRRLVNFLTKFHRIKEAEAELAKAYFDADPDAGEFGGPPNIIHGYPRQSGPFPCWALVLAGDGLKQRYLGDDIGSEETDDDGELIDMVDPDGGLAEGLGAWEEVRIDVHTYVQWTPDIGLYYYHLLRSILISSVGDFYNVNGMTLTNFGGRDLIPDERYLPKDMWVRVLSLTFEQELVGWTPRAEGTTIEGAHVGHGDEPEDGLKRNISAYTEE